SRAGRKMEPLIRGSIKRYPKLKGYKFKSFKDIVVLNLSVLNKKFNEGEKVTPQILVSKKLVSRVSGRTPKVKILATGKIEKGLFFENCLFSNAAKEKIEKANGKIKAKSVKEEKSKQ
ncbi:MAG: uL15 family ribosomal protein, partial [Candidatus Pacebacteria bacterium]|nr:uL15 family ribosomal protein [Candidatus Paceibacterota bacterium]